jgi:FkbM family methyltransferase
MERINFGGVKRGSAETSLETAKRAGPASARLARSSRPWDKAEVTVSAAPSDTMEIVELFGVRVALDPAAMSPEMCAHIRAGTYETREAQFLPRIIDSGERLLELGGGVGLLSAIASRTGRAAAITLVEANPELAPTIRRTFELNGMAAEVVNAAVVAASTSETLPFYLHEHFWASSLAPVKKRLRRGVVDVPAAVLDELVLRHRPTFLIVDVEGTEVELVEGSQLPGVQKILMELHHKVIGAAGVKRVFDRLSQLGFGYDPIFSQAGVVLFRRVVEAGG